MDLGKDVWYKLTFHLLPDLEFFWDRPLVLQARTKNMSEDQPPNRNTQLTYEKHIGVIRRRLRSLPLSSELYDFLHGNFPQRQWKNIHLYWSR